MDFRDGFPVFFDILSWVDVITAVAKLTANTAMTVSLVNACQGESHICFASNLM